MVKLLDGKSLSEEILLDLKERVSSHKRKPGLAFYLIGENPASQIYVKMKAKACGYVGFDSRIIELPETITQKQLLHEIEKGNVDPKIDGILVQMPLPQHIHSQEIMRSIDPNKDVDGFHPINVGKMLLGDEDGFLPCTPHGVKLLLEKYGVQVEKKHVVIVGRSNIVGKPLAAILVQKKKGCNATVTITHSDTVDLAKHTLSADILVAAMGKHHFIRKEMVKKGAVVVDVGQSKVYDPENKKMIIVGDVDFQEVSKVASYITPVPGGVGPMTIACLMQNTYKSYLQRSS